jgi:hypothetical protein
MANEKPELEQRSVELTRQDETMRIQLEQLEQTLLTVWC